MNMSTMNNCLNSKNQNINFGNKSPNLTKVSKHFQLPSLKSGDLAEDVFAKIQNPDGSVSVTIPYGIGKTKIAPPKGIDKTSNP